MVLDDVFRVGVKVSHEHVVFGHGRGGGIGLFEIYFIEGW